MSTLTLREINGFFQNKRLGIIGVSRNKNHYSRRLFSELCSRGYAVIPINPSTEQIEGVRCYPSVKKVIPSLEQVIILLPTEKTEPAVKECLEAGIKTIWLHQHIAKGVINTRVIYLCEEKDVQLITGFCPFMFMPKTAWIHRLHGKILKFMGAYPK